MDMSALGAALASLNAAKDIAQAMIGLRDAAAFQGKMIEFQSKILDAQNSAFAANDERSALIERVRKLEKQVADLEAWKAEKQRYELKSVYAGGAFAYVLKPEAQGSEPPHWICAACYENGHKSILQRSANPLNGRWPYLCSTCKAVIYAGHEGPASKVPSRGPGKACPRCGQPEFRIEKSMPDATFGDLGVVRRQMKCGSCGFEESENSLPGS